MNPMREILIEVSVSEQIENKYTATSEELVTINENKIYRNISVEVHQKDMNGRILQNLTYFIQGENYDLIMSANPDFAPNKLENEYREIDIWHIIDSIRAEQTQI